MNPVESGWRYFEREYSAVKMTQGYILLEMAKKEAVITVEHINKPGSERRTVYRLSSNNRTVRSDIFGTLLANELIKPNNDGLFEGQSQTYSFRRSTDNLPDDGQ